MNTLGLLRGYLLTNPLALLILALFHVTGVMAGWFGSPGHWAARHYSRLLLWVSGVSVQKQGLDHMPRDGAFVLVANHRSLIDTPILMAHLPADFRFLAKASLFQLPIIGGHLQRGGHIGVVREDARSAVKGLAQAAQLLKEGLSVLLFAEGSRSSGNMQDFKGGAAHLAIRTGATVVPVALSGTPEILPKGSMTIRPGRVRLIIGEPIRTSAMTPRDRDGLTTELQNRVTSLLTDC
ncbi:MAG: 1-acyl-sn-glycerol-3-phosphate acyltransferase [Acidobacteriia bacterium]|nr:1-acyl-sn-glycerol-3-phosphate acyltransferase [Terriglobia bacterium]